MAKTLLRANFLTVAIRMQEAADAVGHNEVRTKLSDAISDAYRGTGKWAYYQDHTGDGETGDVVYSCDGDLMMAPYSISDVGGKSSTVIDMDNAKDVVPVTRYQEEAEEDDHYAAMSEAFKTAKLYTELPLYERFISKQERDKADSEDFAGKGKSFPILKPEDVQAAVHAMGRAGSDNLGSTALKNRIIAIAKRKGWSKYLPKAWQGGGDPAKTSEADNVSRETSLKLT
jgi:hypothetical protein